MILIIGKNYNCSMIFKKFCQDIKTFMLVMNVYKEMKKIVKLYKNTFNTMYYKTLKTIRIKMFYFFVKNLSRVA